MTQWAKLPLAWIRNDDKLREFNSRDLCASVSALKIYIYLVMRANYKPNQEYDEAGFVKSTYDELETALDMSRASIAAGIDKLKKVGLINVQKIGRSSLYQITDYDDKRGWGKVPKRYLYGGKRLGFVDKLHEFSTRNRAHLNALKIYLLLICFRNGQSGYSALTYGKITDYSGISREKIRSALSVLYEWRLINLDPETTTINNKQRPPNKYKVLGL